MFVNRTEARSIFSCSTTGCQQTQSLKVARHHHASPKSDTQQAKPQIESADSSALDPIPFRLLPTHLSKTVMKQQKLIVESLLKPPIERVVNIQVFSTRSSMENKISRR